MIPVLRRYTAALLLGLVLFVSTAGILSAPKQAHAVLGVGDVSTTVADTPRFIEWLKDALQKLGESALLASISTALINTATYAADRLAYDAAVFIASGGDGDDPLFENRTVGEYFRDYGASVAGEALGEIDATGILGNFSLCNPDISITLAFKFGIQAAFQRPEPACDFKAVQENWNGFLQDVSTTLDSPFEKNSIILTQLANAYNPKENDFSVGILLYSSVFTKAQQDAALAAQRELFGGFFKDKTNFITGRVETPAELIQKRLDATWMASDEIRNKIAIQALGDKDILLQIGVHAGSVFTNTLLSKVTERVYNGLFNNLDQTDINPFDSGSYANGNADDARESYRSFLTATILSVQNYSLLDDFSACPYQGKGLYNCVADSSFVSAVARADGGVAVTVAEALEEGLLNSAWPLIPSSDQARNQDIYCYTYGYCHGNLVKLRKARIISTGWELAAESTANSESSPVTLGEVVDGFYDCNEQNELDDNHPWCHLIDPNWVLKYPETQCRNQAYGEILTTSVSDERQTECVDMPSCIDEDGNGTCTGGYGYCVREENVWNFRGEECPDYYGSCSTYQNPDGEETYFLSNTTDSGICTSDSAGCMWYQTQKEDDGSGVMDWPDFTTAAVLALAEAEDDIYKNRMYFTSSVEECTADDAGCRELVGREDGTTLNMIQNPSFEEDEDGDDVPDGWFVAGTISEYRTNDTSVALSGTDAVNPGASGIYYQPGIVLTQGAEYTLSVYARQDASTATTGVLLAASASNGETVDFRGYNLNGDCAVYSSDTSVLEITGTPTSTTYERFSCTFTVPTLLDSAAEVAAYVDITGGAMWFDSIQLEQEAEASEFHEGYSSTALDLAYVKVPPTYLGCTGGEDDPEACDEYAGVCSQVDVGCSLYTPTNGDPSVSGIAGELDACPQVCAGYDTFKQEATRYEPEGDFPVYFIPDSAEECSAQYIGCDEFTNIASEEASYFTYIRACVTSDQAAENESSSDAAAVFYTWEGSDTAGYQLKTWNLLESDMGPVEYSYTSGVGKDTDPDLAPCTSWTATDSGISCNDDSEAANVLDADTEECDEHDDTITNPDCREFYDADGNIHYREWTTTVTVNDACVSYRKSELVGVGEDGDADSIDDGQENCEASGGYFDETTSTCRYYGYAEESFSCPAAESGCREYTGGRSRNSRQAFLEYFEEDTLANWDADSAADVTLSNESIATDGHSLLSDGETVWTYVGGDGTVCSSDDGCETTSSEGAFGSTCLLSNGDTYCGTLSEDTFSGKTYTVSFWAKGTGTLSVGFDTARTSGTPTIDASFASGSDAITLGTDWQEYTYGPLNMDASTYPDFGNGATTLVFTPGSSTAFYIDNVILREGEDNIDVIKDSWVTPASCDQTEDGTTSPQYMLGCQEYSDQNGDSAYLKSFSSLCDESKVGCSSYFMTQESDSTAGAVYGAHCSTLSGAVATAATSCYYAQNSGGTDYDTASEFLCTIGIGYSFCEFNLDWYAPQSELPSHISYEASTVVSPADKDIFLVVNSDVECSADVAGCMEVGLPVFSQDHTAVDSWTTTYLMNTPDEYSETLCSADELFCDAWTDSSGTTSYFKDPQNKTCDYRTDVTIDNVTYNGWFKTDTDEPCDPEYVIGGDAAGIWKNGDDGYAGWVGVCLNKYDTCSEFQDVSDLATDELYSDADGESYYYLNNDALEENSLPDSQKCNGEVSQTDGCGLFNDTSDPAKTSNASATYVASTNADELFGAQQNDYVDPIDCDDGASASTITTPSGETVDLCANRCWYSASDLYDINGASSTYAFDGSCYSNSDCRPLQSESGAEVTGFCASSYGGTDAPRLENDSNIVLKVNRDRECAEWLSCSDAQTTWDERTNSYVTICGDVGLCTRYSGTSDASFCSEWKDNSPAIALTTDVYSSRDVSWYGNDYSGYAIPDLLPVDQLSQVNVADPFVCDTVDSGDATLALYDGRACDDDTDCGASTSGDMYCKSNPESDYRLGYIAGSCEGDEFGEDCTVGYCSNSGSACVNSDACGVDGGNCVIGTCYAVSSNLCASSADCSTGQSCIGGYCATDSGDAYIDGEDTDATTTADNYNPGDPNASCGSGETFYASVNFKTGSCMYDQCVIAPNGSTFNETTSETQYCRSYPEINSPFGNEIVTIWQDPATLSQVSDAGDDHENSDAFPVSFVQNFENVQTCALGEECECSYKKITYGDDSVIRYYDLETEIDLTLQGICITGDVGAFCSTDSDCGSTSDTCQLPSQIDDVLGLEGYCLERDSSTNILGDRDLNACLSWLPVDQLAGSTDLYAKYTEAGYFDETNYCTYLDAYATVNTTWGCLEQDDTESRVYLECMNENTLCPAGFVMVAGPYVGADDDGDGNKVEESTDTNGQCKDGDNDCPFMCVPIGSYNNEGENCMDLVEGYMDGNDFETHVNSPPTYDLARYWISTIGEYDTAFAALDSCTASGVQYSETDDYYSIGTGIDGENNSWGWLWDSQMDGCGGGDCGWYDYNGAEKSTPYLGCREFTQVSSGDPTDGAAPWTDVLLNTNNEETSLMERGLINSSYTAFGYLRATTSSPFGATQTIAEMLGTTDASPSYVAQCRTESGSSTTAEFHLYPPTGTPTSGPGGLTCDTGDEVGSGVNASEAAAFMSWDDYAYEAYYWPEITPATFTSVAADGGGPSGILNRIFARGLAVYEFVDGVYDEDGTPRDSDETTDGTIQEVTTYASEAPWDDRAEYGSAPSVWALDLGSCYNDQCEEDEAHPLTLNEQNEGDIEADMFYRAYLKFYAAADKNQLPIRRVIVDWGDGSTPTGSTSNNNYYKNHRGLEENKETSVCDKLETDSDYEWGMTSESCDPNYFSYNHIYTCNPSRMTETCDDGGDDGIIDNAPCTLDGNQCVFRPRVHIRDNWGICTGSCTVGGDGKEICVDNDGSITSSTNSATATWDECNHNLFPSSSITGDDPWVYYDGIITVTP